MTKTVNFRPEGLHTVTPHLVVAGAAAAIDFLMSAFGAEAPSPPMLGADGTSIAHAHLKLGDSTIFLSDPGGLARPTAANLFLYVPDVDRVAARALAAGAKVIVPVCDMFWGDRWGMIEDPFGNVWQLATHVEDVSPDEMKRRAANLPRPS